MTHLLPLRRSQNTADSEKTARLHERAVFTEPSSRKKQQPNHKQHQLLLLN